MTRRVAVVGGCGFIGRHIIHQLLQEKVEVISLHRSPAHERSTEGISCLSVDYRDQFATERVLGDVEALIHLGSQSLPRTSVSLGVSGVLAEVEANSLLFEVAAKVGVETVIFASSGGSVYGDCERGVAISESRSPQPITPHGLLKVMTELALAHVARTSGQNAVSLRPGNVYGPGQRSKVRYGVVPTFIGNIRSGAPSEIWGAEVVRDYVFVEDAARAFVHAALNPHGLPAVLNVGTGVGHTALEVYSILQQELGISQSVNVVPRPESDPEWSVLDNSRLRDFLGFTPQLSLAEGLHRTVNVGGPSRPPLVAETLQRLHNDGREEPDSTVGGPS